MSKMRRKLRIVVDGREHIITTSARDTAAAEQGADDASGIEQTMRVVHAAMVRLRIDVPSSWEAFADLIDEFDDLEPDDDTDDAVPIRATA